MMLNAAVFVALAGVAAYFLFGRESLTKTPKEMNPQYDYIVDKMHGLVGRYHHTLKQLVNTVDHEDVPVWPLHEWSGPMFFAKQFCGVGANGWLSDRCVIGGGSSGAVLATRLSEDPDVTVLLLEAGGEENDIFYAHVPGLVAFLQQTSADWSYVTEPQLFSHKQLKDQRGIWPRGKLLGGTSVLNYMIYNRGDVSDYDRWGNTDGCHGWTYNDLIPYFKKIETCQTKSEFRGNDGPMYVRVAGQTAITETFLRAVRKKTKLPVDEDYNEPGKHQGWHRTQYNLDDHGWRESTGSVYLRPAMRTRSNLHVVTHAHVTKINFDTSADDADPAATGVEFTWMGAKQKQRVRVLINREVLLTAGAVATPQILMLSGIGDEKHLKEHNIPVIANLPAVGQNLHDHMILVGIASTNDSSVVKPLDNPVQAIRELLAYAFAGKGALSSVQAPIIAHLTSGHRPGYQSDVQHYLFTVDVFMRGKLAYLNNQTQQSMNELYHAVGSRHAFAFCSALNHPLSVGFIRLKSADPFDHPVIQPNYLENPKDLEIYAEAHEKFVKLLTETSEMKKFDIRVTELCEDTTPGTSAYFKCLVQSRAQTLFHPHGTAKMGGTASDSVVNNKLKVHGVRSLRVVDISVLPDTIGANPNVAAMVLAERAADSIKHEYKQ